MANNRKVVDKRKAREVLLRVIKDLTRFYRPLIQRIVSRYQLRELEPITMKFGLAIEYESEAQITERQSQLALISCHLALKCLGDMSRYRELEMVQEEHQRDWGPACGYYNLAKALCPERGECYNQLAMVAVHVQDQISAIFFFEFALSVKKPFPDAKRNLASTIKNEGVGKNTELPMKQLARLFIDLYDASQVGPESKKVQGKFVETMESMLKDQVIPAKTMNKIIISLISVLHRRLQSGDDSIGNQRFRSRTFDALLAVFSTLLNNLESECQMKAKSSGNLNEAKTNATLRRILPGLRILSKWLCVCSESNWSIWRRCVGLPPVELALYDFWHTYCATLTTLTHSIDMDKLGRLSDEVEEDLEFRGFLPLAGKLHGRQISKEPMGLRRILEFAERGHGPSQIHPSDEMTMRIRDLYDDAVYLLTLPSVQIHRSGNVFELNADYGSQEKSSTTSSRELLSSPVSNELQNPMPFSLGAMVDSIVDQEDIDVTLSSSSLRQQQPVASGASAMTAAHLLQQVYSFGGEGDMNVSESPAAAADGWHSPVGARPSSEQVWSPFARSPADFANHAQRIPSSFDIPMQSAPLERHFSGDERTPQFSPFQPQSPYFTSSVQHGYK